MADLKEIDYLVDLNLLRDLNLINNPINKAENYRLSVVFKLPKLNILDRIKIDPTDKVNSKNLFHPSPEYIASRDHMTNFIFNIIQDHQVRERFELNNYFVLFLRLIMNFLKKFKYFTKY